MQSWNHSDFIIQIFPKNETENVQNVFYKSLLTKFHLKRGRRVFATQFSTFFTQCYILPNFMNPNRENALVHKLVWVIKRANECSFNWHAPFRYVFGKHRVQKHFSFLSLPFGYVFDVWIHQHRKYWIILFSYFSIAVEWIWSQISFNIFQNEMIYKKIWSVS